ncbi:acyl-CoA carboxylase epsilon subunit [Streptomyces sp. NPDC002580]|uniref:acyl-CoA carboxylase epsilon subunit n=1 Tax=Streptomyces sp. NPDC002580 TaxID=3364653 RepID=UPI0036CA3F0B
MMTTPLTLPDGVRDPLVRVVKGEPADEELAALTAVLLARAEAVQDVSRTGGGTGLPARWRPAGYRSPLSWHGGVPATG